MSDAEMQRLKLLARRSLHLALLLNKQRITEGEYIDRLNALRHEYSLWPIQPRTDHPREQTKKAISPQC